MLMFVGDVVRLISGGPKMTIAEFLPNNKVGCDWFEGTTLHRDCYPKANLQLVK